MIRATLMSVSIALAVPAGAMASTTITTIDFNGLVVPGFGPGSEIVADFSTLEVAVTQDAYDGALGQAGQDVTRNVGDGLLRFWDTGYSGLTNIAYVDPNASVGEFIFAPQAGFSVTIESFQMTSFIGSTETVDVEIFEVVGTSWSSLWSASGTTLTDLTNPLTFMPGVTGTGPLYLQWTLSGSGNIDNVGIDTITFSSAEVTAPIPLPASLPLLLGGLGLLGLMVRRRRAA